MPNSYAASVPATPTYDYATGVLDGSLRHNSVSSAASVTSGRPSISHSAATSRRPSLAHIMPGLKTETDYMNTPSFARFSNYEISPYSDNSPGHVDQVGLESAFWRLTSSPMTPNPYGGISQHMSLGSMSSLNSAEASDTQDDPIWPSRMNSIDQGMITGFSFPSTYSSDVEYNSVIPEMYHTSASASTASLTASISEVSQFGDTRLPSQVFMRQWVDTTPVSPHISEKIIRNDNFDNYYPVDDRYGQITVEESIIFPSPLQSPKFVPHVG